METTENAQKGEFRQALERRALGLMEDAIAEFLSYTGESDEEIACRFLEEANLDCSLAIRLFYKNHQKKAFHIGKLKPEVVDSFEINEPPSQLYEKSSEEEILFLPPYREVEPPNIVDVEWLGKNTEIAGLAPKIEEMELPKEQCNQSSQPKWKPCCCLKQVCKRVLEQWEIKDDYLKRNLLHMEAIDNHPLCIRALLWGKKKMDVDVGDRNGTTPLHFAAKNEEPTSLKVLLEFEASLNPRDEEDATPMHFAAYCGTWKCIEALIQAGAEVNPLDEGWSTPLHYACEEGHLESVRKILETYSHTQMARIEALREVLGSDIFRGITETVLSEIIEFSIPRDGYEALSIRNEWLELPVDIVLRAISWAMPGEIRHRVSIEKLRNGCSTHTGEVIREVNRGIEQYEDSITNKAFLELRDFLQILKLVV